MASLLSSCRRSPAFNLSVAKQSRDGGRALDISRIWRSARGSLIVACMLTVAIAITAVAGFRLRTAYQDAWSAAESRGRLLTDMVAIELDRAISSFALSLDAAAENFEEPGVSALPERMRRLVIFDRAAQAAGYGEIVLADAHGAVQMSSRGSQFLAGLNVAHREYFQYHRDHPGSGVRVSPPIRTVTGAFGIPVSRARIPSGTGEGHFAGVVVGIVDLSVWTNLVGHLQLQDGDELLLFRDDGVVLLRAPTSVAVGDTETVATALRTQSGSVRVGQYIVGGADLERLHTTTEVGRTGLFLSIGLSRHGIEAEWHSRLLRISGMTAAMLALIGTATVVLILEQRRRRDAEMGVRRSEAQLRMMAECSSDVVSVIGLDGRRTYVSPASHSVLGIAPEDLLGQSPTELAHADDRPAMVAAMQRLRSRQTAQECMTYRTRHARTGAEIWLETVVRPIVDPEADRHEGCVAVARDITARKLVEAQLRELASLDGLTGLANRRSFDATLEREWRRCSAANEPISVLLVDVDYFKRFNDHHGHQSGDECLKAVASALGAAVRGKGDLVARYGGEEFAVILPGADSEAAKSVAERLRNAVVTLSIQHEGRPDESNIVTVSVGSATRSPGSTTSSTDETLRCADCALYAAKEAGRNLVSTGCSKVAVEVKLQDDALPA